MSSDNEGQNGQKLDDDSLRSNFNPNDTQANMIHPLSSQVSNQGDIPTPMNESNTQNTRKTTKKTTGTGEESKDES